MNAPQSQRERITVVGPFGQHQVDLPLDVPVSALVPDLLAMTGMSPRSGAAADDAWRLAGGDGRVLAGDGTLAAQSIRTGDVIYLRGQWQHAPAAGEAGPADVRDLPTAPLGVAAGAPPADDMTPLQRTAALLPEPAGRPARLCAAAGAFLRRGAAGRGGADGPLGAAAEADGRRLLPADLTVTARVTRMESARTRWRELDHLGQLDARITGPRLRHCATVAVVSPKGGVGKTTVSALLGTLFSLLRRDPIVAVDTNPDFGSLGRVLTPGQSWCVDDLARLVAEDDDLSLTGLESHLGRAIHGLLVVPAPTDPDRMAALDEQAYRQVVSRLKDFFSLILLDCGTGLQDPASAAAIATADQVLLVTDAQPATASLVTESAQMLSESGRPITVVVNRMPDKGSKLDLQQLSRYLPDARGLVVIPDDMTAATRLASGGFDWRDAPASWQLAVRRLAAVLVADWAHLGLTR